jgi:hypothetical protein
LKDKIDEEMEGTPYCLTKSGAEGRQTYQKLKHTLNCPWEKLSEF